MKVAVVKYNAGNIRSVDYALKRLGVEAVITADKEELQSADKVIFPGVGEAETTMNHLKATGLDELIKNLRQPVFGICLGMQLMCRHSEEGEVDCLNIFDVDVKRFVPQKHEDKVCLLYTSDDADEEDSVDLGGCRIIKKKNNKKKKKKTNSTKQK